VAADPVLIWVRSGRATIHSSSLTEGRRPGLPPHASRPRPMTGRRICLVLVRGGGRGGGERGELGSSFTMGIFAGGACSSSGSFIIRKPPARRPAMALCVFQFSPSFWSRALFPLSCRFPQRWLDRQAGRCTASTTRGIRYRRRSAFGSSGVVLHPSPSDDTAASRPQQADLTHQSDPGGDFVRLLHPDTLCPLHAARVTI